MRLLFLFRAVGASFGIFALSKDFLDGLGVRVVYDKNRFSEKNRNSFKELFL